MKLSRIVITVLLWSAAGFTGAIARTYLDHWQLRRDAPDMVESVRGSGLAGSPTPSNDSIDLAMHAFHIRVPPGAEWPVYDEKMEDYGGYEPLTRTTRIGPRAFSSWAVLGSTLAHEVEVHAERGYLDIITAWFELGRREALRREEERAWAHEIESAGRFGLSDAEVAHIRAGYAHYKDSAP